ncbi:uncharacterized protein LOC125493567 [Beta vulgaris subsp. vulgaris]|uniref:uncharacterized protein LOC125493567 n=1 Tax=Beta vulgaris subsp. vulgaris TaxID=3555 RepID=UPI0020368F28|nr:uncharacterized protein LOC125493567 [Beta vulgaris subsp. vulgaris]
MAKKISTLKPPASVGREDPLFLEKWIRDFEKKFTATGTPAAQKVDQATFYLHEDVDTWQKYNEFNRLNQSYNISVQECAQKFNEYARFCPTVVPVEGTKAQKFEDALNFDLQTRMDGSTSTTFAEAYAKASNLERILQCERGVLSRHKRKEPTGNNNSQGYDKRPNNNNGGCYKICKNQNSGQHAQKGNRNQKNFVCKKCAKSHRGLTCQGERIKCFECGEVGHKSFNCPKTQAQNGPNGNNGYNGGGYIIQNFNNNLPGGGNVAQNKNQNNHSFGGGNGNYGKNGMEATLAEE